MQKSYPLISGRNRLNWVQWILILLANVVAYCCLLLPYFIELPNNLIFDYDHPLLIAALFKIIIVSLFLFIQIIALRLITGHEWRHLFHRPTLKELGIALIFFILTYVISIVTGLISKSLFSSVSGSAAAGLSIKTPHVWGIFAYERLTSAIQIIGEEFLALMPFLAFTRLADYFNLPKATWWGNIISSLIFSLLHLSTYDFNIGYVILGLTFTRIILTWSYQKTQNIWISFLVHYLFDTLSFLALLFA